MNPAMFVSVATIAAICCWWRTISGNEVPCAASVVATICPVSCVGMNPVGTSLYKITVPTRTASENMSAANL